MPGAWSGCGAACSPPEPGGPSGGWRRRHRIERRWRLQGRPASLPSCRAGAPRGAAAVAGTGADGRGAGGRGRRGAGGFGRGGSRSRLRRQSQACARRGWTAVVGAAAAAGGLGGLAGSPVWGAYRSVARVARGRSGVSERSLGSGGGGVRSGALRPADRRGAGRRASAPWFDGVWAGSLRAVCSREPNRGGSLRRRGVRVAPGPGQGAAARDHDHGSAAEAGNQQGAEHGKGRNRPHRPAPGKPFRGRIQPPPRLALIVRMAGPVPFPFGPLSHRHGPSIP
jgi:hypothetical protein